MIVICVQSELTENEVEAKDYMHLYKVFSDSRDQVHWWIFFFRSSFSIVKSKCEGFYRTGSLCSSLWNFTVLKLRKSRVDTLRGS